jgi:DNA-binding MarR family transcriptional regulator
LAAGFEAHGDGLRGYHYRLLAAIDEYGAASQADLGRSVGIDRSDVTAALAELESRKLIKRTTDPEHKRRKIVTMTPLGGKKLLALDTLVDSVQEDFLKPLSARQRREFVVLLERLVAEDGKSGSE